jgi:hypothetical protein
MGIPTSTEPTSQAAPKDRTVPHWLVVTHHTLPAVNGQAAGLGHVTRHQATIVGQRAEQ